MEKREDRCRVDDLLHDVPRDSLLRPDASEAIRPRAPELRHAVVVVEVEVPRAGLLGGGCLRNFAVYFFSKPPLGPCRLLALCAVVLGLGKGHRDAHPCILEVSTEASLSPAAGTACAAACIAINVHHRPLESQKRLPKKQHL